MELKYKNWKDITVNVYQRLKAINDNATEELGILNTNIEMLSVLCDCDEEEILNLGTNKFSRLLLQTEFLKDMPKAKIQDKYIINGHKYDVFLTLKEMSVAQYIDFQTYSRDKEKNIKEMLSVFLIPHGKKYGEGYDVGEVINEIGEHLSIVDAYSVLFFFILLYQSLTKVILDCSTKDLKKMLKKTKNKEEKEKLNMAIMEMEKAETLAKSGVGFIL